MKHTWILFVFLAGLSDTYAQPVAFPKPRHHFTVIAHRGSHLFFPENTLEAYSQAIEDGADYIEIDLRTSKDGELISLHNATTDHMTGVKGTVKEMMLKDLQSLRIQSSDSLDKRVYRIPTFEQILKLCQGKIYIYIDLKDAPAEPVVKLLKKYKMEREVLVYINAESQYEEWRQFFPSMPLMISLPGAVNSPEKLKEFVTAKKPDLLDGGWRDYTPEMIQLAKSLRLLVWPDIQSRDENPALWQQAIEKGFTGLQTDHPAQLVQYLRSKGLR